MKARALSVINELIRPVGFIRLVDFSSVHDLFIWSWRILIMLINFQAAKTNCAAITWFLFVNNSRLSVFLQFPIVCLFNSFKKRISSQSDHRFLSQCNAFANLAWSVAPCIKHGSNAIHITERCFSCIKHEFTSKNELRPL